MTERSRNRAVPLRQNDGASKFSGRPFRKTSVTIGFRGTQYHNAVTQCWAYDHASNRELRA